MSKWIKFSRKFNFQPANKSAVTMQYQADQVAQVTDECAAKAIAKSAGVEVEAPANAAEAEGLKDGTQDAKVIDPPPPPADDPTPPARKPRA